MKSKLFAFTLIAAVLSTANLGGQTATKQIKKAAGVLICVPVKGSGAPEPYWVGYRDYMYFYVAGLPQLPANTSGMCVTRATNDRRLKNGLAMTGPTAVEVARVLGLDYALCGTVKTTSGRHTLSLQVWDASTGKPVGAPMISSGSQAELSQRMKPLLFRIVDRLGIALTPAQRMAYEEIVPPSKETLTVLGEASTAANRAVPSSAVAKLKGLASKDPAVAVQQTDSADSDKAVQIVQGIAERYPEFVTPHLLLGSYLTSAGKLKEADAVIDEGLRRYPDNFRLLFTRYRLRNKQEDFGRQLRVAEEMARLYPKAAVSWMLVAESASGQASDIRKGRYWTKLSAVEENRVLNLYGRVIYAGEKAVAHDPKYVYAWTDLQWHYMATSQIRKSEQAFEKAVAIDPGNSSAYATAIQMLEDVWSHDPARKTKQEAIVARAMKATLDDSDRGGRSRLIDRLMKSDFNKEAVTHLEAALKQFNGQFPDAHELLAKAYAKLGDQRRAEEEAVLSIQAAKTAGSTDLPEKYAWDMFWDKNYSLARLYFDEALTHCPDCTGDYCLARAICNWEIGRHDAAVEDWQRVLAVSGKEHDLAAEFGLAVGAFVAGDTEKGKAEGLRLVHIEHRLVSPEFIDDGLRWKVTLKDDARKLIDALIEDGLSLPDMGIPGR